MAARCQPPLKVTPEPIGSVVCRCAAFPPPEERQNRHAVVGDDSAAGGAVSKLQAGLVNVLFASVWIVVFAAPSWKVDVTQGHGRGLPDSGIRGCWASGDAGVDDRSCRPW